MLSCFNFIGLTTRLLREYQVFSGVISHAEHSFVCNPIAMHWAQGATTLNIEA